MAIHAASIEGKDVEARRSLVARQKINMTQLAKLMGTFGEQAHVVAAMRRMTCQTVFLDGRVFIK